MLEKGRRGRGAGMWGEEEGRIGVSGVGKGEGERGVAAR